MQNVSATNRTLNLTVLPGFGYAVAVVALFRNVESGLIESSRPNLNISNLGESNAVLTVQPTTGTSTGSKENTKNAYITQIIIMTSLALL